jgi:hypothetical protein
VFRLPNPWLILAGLLACGLIFWTGLSAGQTLERGRAASTEQLARAMEAAALRGAAEAIAKNRPINRYQTEVLEREVVRVPDYSRCVHSADSMRALNAALEDRPLATGDRVVSEADTVERQHVRSDNLEAR